VAASEGLAGSASTIADDDLRQTITRAIPNAHPNTIGELVDTARSRVVPRNQTVFRQGEPIPLTLMVRGYGAFRRTTVDGRQVMTGIAKPGDLIGFSSISAAHSSVDLLALTESEAATWAGPGVRLLVARDPGLSLDIIDRLGGFLQVLTEKVDGFLHQDARRRVVRILARHRDLFFDDPPILTRSHLPSLVGTSREMTGRVLRELENEGTLDRVGSMGLRLLRPDKLDADARHESDEAAGPPEGRRRSAERG
jgi:CRP-like cAMP-binding protein